MTLPIELKAKAANVFYRYMDSRRSNGIDEYDNPLPGYTLVISCHEYKILSKTPKGTWIEAYNIHGKRFILDDARRKWAHPNRPAALVSFIRRKEVQINIITHQLRQAKLALAIANNSSIKSLHEAVTHVP